jgi:hypothetical protein
MDLNEKLVEKVATLLKIDASNLKEALQDVSKELELPEKVYTQPEVDILSDNIQKEKYESGKTAGIEMTLKGLKKEYTEELGVELDDVKDYKGLISKLNDFKTEKLKIEIENIKKDSGVESNAQIEALTLKLEKFETEKAALQKEIKDRELTYTNKEHQMKKDFNREKGDNALIRELSGLKYNIPKTIENLGEEKISDYLKTEQLKTLTLFKSQFTIDYDDEGKQIVLDNITGEPIKTDLQEFEKLENLIMPFAKKNYINIQSEEKAGRNTQKGKGMKLSLKGMTRDEFFAYAEKEGLKQNTDDFDTAYSEFTKANK